MTAAPPRTRETGRTPAVFLDRDGTIIEDAKYLSAPERVALIPGAARAIARLNSASIPVIVVSNQSGIGRGYYSRADFERVEVRVREALGQESAHLDAVYVCPHAPEERPPCECRKPGTLLYRTASFEHSLDLSRSWFVGDRWRDVAASFEFGGEGILVPSPATPAEELARARESVLVMASLAAVAARVLGSY